MKNQQLDETSPPVTRLEDVASMANYSLLNALNCDPDATADGEDYLPRQVFAGHYVPVKPTPIAEPEYVTHSKHFFRELKFDDSLAQTEDFRRMFSGDLSRVPAPMRKIGWARSRDQRSALGNAVERRRAHTLLPWRRWACGFTLECPGISCAGTHARAGCPNLKITVFVCIKNGVGQSSLVLGRVIQYRS